MKTTKKKIYLISNYFIFRTIFFQKTKKKRAQRHFNDAELTSMMCSSENSDQSDSEYEFSSHKQVFLIILFIKELFFPKLENFVIGEFVE